MDSCNIRLSMSKMTSKQVGFWAIFNGLNRCGKDVISMKAVRDNFAIQVIICPLTYLGIVANRCPLTNVQHVDPPSLLYSDNSVVTQIIQFWMISMLGSALAELNRESYPYLTSSWGGGCGSSKAMVIIVKGVEWHSEDGYNGGMIIRVWRVVEVEHGYNCRMVVNVEGGGGGNDNDGGMLILIVVVAGVEVKVGHGGGNSRNDSRGGGSKEMVVAMANVAR
ncbi:hypothetical protein Acr_26g0003210 [Actinidia rufa]|uniref:Uncharacterized protein n=1 Tax=Actinidia rufa TaxID=165716 RepID=A0A7J0H233_9ERIC|nr:hypothetical protein Acr_26g0003210 [Actinidia rufa]